MTIKCIDPTINITLTQSLQVVSSNRKKIYWITNIGSSGRAPNINLFGTGCYKINIKLSAKLIYLLHIPHPSGKEYFNAFYQTMQSRTNLAFLYKVIKNIKHNIFDKDV